MKHFTDISEIEKSEIENILIEAIELKKSNIKTNNYLKGKNLILLFEKTSTRTRLSFDIAIKQLDGISTILNSNDIHLASGKETIEDTIKTFGLYSDGIIMRVNNHETILKSANISEIPVINALSNVSHPCQCMAGMMTLIEEKGSLHGLNIVWMGPITNVTHSWIEAYLKDLGFNFTIFCPSEWTKKYLNKLKEYEISLNINEIVKSTIDEKTLSKADVIMTDTWQSMGDQYKSNELSILNEFKVTNSIMNSAKKESIFMHCLPANRNQEVEKEVIDGSQSRVWQEASNRLHVQKQILKNYI